LGQSHIPTRHESETSDGSQAKSFQDPGHGFDADRSQLSASLDQLSKELRLAQAEILLLRQELAEARQIPDQTLSDLQAEIATHKREISKLNGELAIAAHDRRLNVTQMARAMIAAERRLRAAGSTSSDLEDRHESILNYVDTLKARYQDLQNHVDGISKERDAATQRLAAITRSMSWRATAPLRQLASSNPRAAQAGLRTLKLVWRALKLRPIVRLLRTGQLREASSQSTRPKLPSRDSSKPGPARPKPAKLPPNDPFSLPVALLSRTGIQNGIVADHLDPWPAHRPLVSVVIPCFNYSQFVAEAVQSVLSQTFQDLEIIVVEGGSSSLESRQDLAEMEFPRTRILLQAEAHRAGANRNFGISQARGKYICCLDADDRIEPTYIEKAVFFAEHYRFDVVATGVEFFGNRSGGYGSLERPVLQDMLQANYVPTCAVFRREFWERAGGFRDSDLSTGHIHEDWLFWVRLAALGARFWNITGERLFKYRVHGVSLSSGQDVLPIEHQRSAIRELNADVLVPGVHERSKELAAQDWRHPEPLRNLDRFGCDIADARRTVLLALPFLIIGGAERLLSSIVAHLGAIGWRVVIVTTVRVGPEHGDTTDWFRNATNEIYHLPRFLKPDRWNDFIDYLIKAKRIGLLWVVGSAAFYERLSYLKTLHPELKVIDLLFNTVGHTANNRKYANLIDLNIVENQEVFGWLTEQGEAPSRVRLIESGLDLVRYSPKPKSPDVLQQLGISDDTIIIGFSGRWSEEKDPLGFIEIAKLVPMGIAVTFVMTGAGPLNKKVEAAIADADFPSGRFHLMGAVPDVAPFIASYDLLCLPSRLDGRPVVVLEALALGVPVLASRVGALPELIEEGVSGRLCEAGDYAAFAERIGQLARDPKGLQQMKGQSRLWAEQKFDARRMLADYETALSGIWARHDNGQSGQQIRLETVE
jgi:glycosyltransferase involved in cell wall biosynthesis